MLSTERQAFADLMHRLADGSGVARSEERIESYWKALAKMGLPAFERVVDHMLGEDYSLAHAGKKATFPSVREVWSVSRGLRNQPRARAPQSRAAGGEDHLEYFSNRLLWMHIAHRGGLGSERSIASQELQDVLEVQRELVAEFCPYIREGDELATPAEFIRRWTLELRRRSKIDARTLKDYERIAAKEHALRPFPAYMGRELAPEQRSLVPT
jgi:hypothetical protein